MFQWFYEFFMTYFMPFVLQICKFLGIDMSKTVHFEGLEDEKQMGGESDVPPSASSASASASASVSGFLSDATQ